METKICNKCNIEKIVTEFYFRSDTKKYRNACKDCIKKAYKEAHKKLIEATDKKQ